MYYFHTCTLFKFLLCNKIFKYKPHVLKKYISIIQLVKFTVTLSKLGEGGIHDSQVFTIRYFRKYSQDPIECTCNRKKVTQWCKLFDWWTQSLNRLSQTSTKRLFGDFFVLKLCLKHKKISKQSWIKILPTLSI